MGALGLVLIALIPASSMSLMEDKRARRETTKTREKRGDEIEDERERERERPLRAVSCTFRMPWKRARRAWEGGYDVWAGVPDELRRQYSLYDRGLHPYNRTPLHGGSRPKLRDGGGARWR